MENIYVQFDVKAYQQIAGIPMGTNCAPQTAELLLKFGAISFREYVSKGIAYPFYCDIV